MVFSEQLSYNSDNMTKILLVEDDKSLREIYGVRLLAEGYDIVSAGDGEEALAMAIKERPTLIISDVMMPKISGFDMLDILRSTTETKDIKVIMMTALSSEDQRERGEALGADQYLVKSQVGIEDVVRSVHEVLGDVPAGGTISTTDNVFIHPPAPRAAAPFTPQRPGAPTTAITPPPRGQQPAPAASQQPQAPQPTPQSSVVTPQPTPAAAAPQQPQTPSPAAQPVSAPSDTFSSPQPGQASNLPQPTAPFSTNRPLGLGDRIIHPVDQPTNQRDFSNLMAQELSGEAPASAPQPAVAAPQQPQVQAAPQPQPAVAAPEPNLTFEETPLPSNQATPQSPQQ